MAASTSDGGEVSKSVQTRSFAEAVTVQPQQLTADGIYHASSEKPFTGLHKGSVAACFPDTVVDD